MNNHLTNIE